MDETKKLADKGGGHGDIPQSWRLIDIFLLSIWVFGYRAVIRAFEVLEGLETLGRNEARTKRNIGSHSA